MTKKPVTRKARTNKRAATKPVDAVPTANDFQAKRAVEMHEEYLNALSSLLTGGLWVDDEQEGLRAEHAICHVAAAQLKAILLSLHASPDDDGADGWCRTDDEMSTTDIAAALGGVVAVLRSSPEVLRHLRSRDEFRSSHWRKTFERARTAGGAS
jgi:hypothetical protein